jgi:hypothetical protein
MPQIKELARRSGNLRCCFHRNAIVSDPIQAWQCIGCGRIEAPQNCVGICQDRRVEFVYAAEHAETERVLASVRSQRDALLALVRRMAFSKPREGEWERSYRALQSQARTALTQHDEAVDANEADAAA